MLGDIKGDCSRFEDDETGMFELERILKLTGIGISDAFGNCGDDIWLVGLLRFDDLIFSVGVFGEDGEMGGLRDDVELVGDDLAHIVFRGRGVGILDAARGDVTGVVFGTSFAEQLEADVTLDSN